MHLMIRAIHRQINAFWVVPYCEACNGPCEMSDRGGMFEDRRVIKDNRRIGDWQWNPVLWRQQ